MRFISVKNQSKFYIETLDLVNWRDIAVNNNGLLLFVISSQFVPFLRIFNV